MPAPAELPLVPPAELADRAEGWGVLGRVLRYSVYHDNGVWPPHPDDLYPSDVMHNEVLREEHPETSDGNWYRNGELIT
jgi:hypothetical protein